ncbi:helix-turn-helix domain-containing protein [Castellaniella sp.]|uniref:helix-turn-helix domain-containing protein n=1 Tax=Castellaniella sp. TaxID=1955812 RepID=UPI002AFF4912|nr:helix-turn-helix domain-containing protein [Castellaniella sp.]
MGASIPLYSLYGQIDTAAELRFLHLESLESRNRVYSWNIRPHRHHDLYQLIWVEQGAGTVMLDEQTLSLQAPVLISIPPPIVHGFRWQPGTKGLILTIAEGFVADLARQSGDEAVHAALGRLLTITGAVDPGSVGRLRGLFETILDEYIHERVCRSTAISGNVLMLFAEVARLRHLSLQKDSHEDSGRMALYRRFKELVEAHYRDPWRVADYAQALATTERNLRRVSIDMAGQPPVRILHRRILLEAKRHLLYTEKTVAEIGYDLGFEDPAYFTRFFARNEKRTPAAFRRSSRQA